MARFPCSYSTAENKLTQAKVSKDDTVLVTGASGGVGSAAIQLALSRGAKVIAITSPAKAEKLEDIGAAMTLDRDVVLVAGPKWPSLIDVLRPFGRYAVSGAIGGAEVPFDVRSLHLKDLSCFGCTVLESEVFGNLIGRIERNEIAPLVAATYPLLDISKAQEAFGEKGNLRKIVLEFP